MIATIIFLVFFLALVVLTVGGALAMSGHADEEIQHLQEKDEQ